MKKRTLKLLSIILATVLFVAMFGGCAKKVDNTDTDNDDSVGFRWENVKYRSELASEFGQNTRPYYDEETGEFDIDGYFAAYGWTADESADTIYRTFEFNSGISHIRLYLGWEDCWFNALDVCNLASVRISTTSISSLCPVKGGEQNGVFPVQFIEAIDAVLSRLASGDCDAESLEEIRAAHCNINVFTYDEAEALFPVGPTVKCDVWRWYDPTTGVFDDFKFLSYYGFDEPDVVGFGTYGVRHRDGDPYLCLMLDPRGSMFTIESVGNIRSIQGVCESADGVLVTRFKNEKAPGSLLVALNAVLDRMSAYKTGELDDLEESLKAIEVEGVSMNVLTDDEAEELDTPEDEPVFPEANNIVKIGNRNIVLANHIDEWRDADGRISIEALFDSFDMWLRDKSDGTLMAYNYSQTFELYASQTDLIDSFSVELRHDNDDVAYQITVKRLNDNAIEETAEGFQISSDLTWLLLYVIEEWNYRRDTLNDDMRTIADGNALGQDLMVEVIPFSQKAP